MDGLGIAHRAHLQGFPANSIGAARYPIDTNQAFREPSLPLARIQGTELKQKHPKLS
jgi:hypothetical protein